MGVTAEGGDELRSPGLGAADDVVSETIGGARCGMSDRLARVVGRVSGQDGRLTAGSFA